MEVDVKSEAMQPHFQRRDHYVRQVENTLILTPSAEPGPASIEILPGPAPAFSFAALGCSRRFQQVVNIVAGTLLLLAAAPLLLLVAIIVYLSSEGPILHRELRVGKNRRGVSLDP